ncbi:MAG: hypothetical protein QOC96_1453 [Acidobacteriota bacterium]|jgi:hypothetical protein|nr:hypothetical protein [Acidobacteriota bacterium]
MTTTQQSEQQGMHRRRITLADGRYMIFYTFDESPVAQTETQGAGDGASEKRESEPQPQAEEERRV